MLGTYRRESTIVDQTIDSLPLVSLSDVHQLRRPFILPKIFLP
jgi:hypothetical protein